MCERNKTEASPEDSILVKSKQFQVDCQLNEISVDSHPQAVRKKTFSETTYFLSLAHITDF